MFHKHKWKIVSTQPIEITGDDFFTPRDVIVGYKTYVALRCETCGDLKSKTIKGAFDSVGEDNA